MITHAYYRAETFRPSSPSLSPARRFLPSHHPTPCRRRRTRLMAFISSLSLPFPSISSTILYSSYCPFLHEHSPRTACRLRIPRPSYLNTSEGTCTHAATSLRRAPETEHCIHTDHQLTPLCCLLPIRVRARETTGTETLHMDIHLRNAFPIPTAQWTGTRTMIISA